MASDDSDGIRDDLRARGAEPVIPMKRNRLAQLPVDGFVYALRNRIERCFNRLKNDRRIATRYDKTSASYLGFALIGAIRLASAACAAGSVATGRAVPIGRRAAHPPR